MLTSLRSFDRCAIGLARAIALVAHDRRLRRRRQQQATVVSNSGTGTIVVVVTDAATDEFLKIWVTVRKVELLGAQGHFTLFEGRRASTCWRCATMRGCSRWDTRCRQGSGRRSGCTSKTCD